MEKEIGKMNGKIKVENKGGKINMGKKREKKDDKIEVRWKDRGGKNSYHDNRLDQVDFLL